MMRWRGCNAEDYNGGKKRSWKEDDDDVDGFDRIYISF